MFELFETKAKVTVPKKPVPPTQLEEYGGYYYDALRDGGTKASTDKGAIDSNQVSWGLSTDKSGGWGRLSMGLVNIALNHGKSYGILGTAETTASYDAQKRSYIYETAKMTGTDPTQKIMLVSLFPKKWDSAA